MRFTILCFLLALNSCFCLGIPATAAEGAGGQSAPPLPPVMVPSDVTNQPMTGGRDPGSRAGRGAYGKPASPWINQPIAGIRQLPPEKFTGLAAHSSDAGLFLEQSHSTDLERTNPYTVGLRSGQIIVSVSRPTKVAMVKTAVADISVQAPAIALISAGPDSLRVVNLVGQNNRVQIRLAGDSPDSPVFAIDSSYEFIYSKGKLALPDLHPADGIGRRNLHLLENGKAAISQVSLYTILNSNDLLAALARSGEDKEKHILSSISKMAAVIGYVDGSGGYMSQPKHP
jgi:hypothetical protein